MSPVSTSAPPSTLIAESDGSGHRLHYVSILTEAALSDGRHVVLMLSHAAMGAARRDHAEFLRHVDDHGVVVIEAELDVGQLRAVAERHEISLTVIPDFDRHLLAFARAGGWRGPGSLRGLMMRSGAASRDPRSFAIRCIKLLIVGLLQVRPGTRIYRLVSALDARAEPGTVPDPISLIRDEDAMSWARSLMPDGAFTFAIVGGIDPRKNVALVAEAVSNLSDGWREVVLVLAGAVHPGYRGVIDHIETTVLPGRSVKLDQRLTDAQIDAVVAVADAVVVAHSNEGPSGILGKAAKAGTRVIAAGARTLKSDIDLIAQDGALWCELDEASLTSAAKLCLRAPRPHSVRTATTHDFAARLLGLP